jgi:hypothetical protein
MNLATSFGGAIRPARVAVVSGSYGAGHDAAAAELMAWLLAAGCSVEQYDVALLHDADRTSTTGSWHRTLTATRVLLDDWQGTGLAVGPLTEHWPPTAPPSGSGRLAPAR